MFSARRISLLTSLLATLAAACAPDASSDQESGSSAATALPQAVVVSCDAEGVLSSESTLATGGKVKISVFDRGVGVGTKASAVLPTDTTAYASFTKADGTSGGFNSDINLTEATCIAATYADHTLVMTEFGLRPTRLTVDFASGKGTMEQYGRHGGGCRDNGFDREPVTTEELHHTLTLSNCRVRPAS